MSQVCLIYKLHDLHMIERLSICVRVLSELKHISSVDVYCELKIVIFDTWTSRLIRDAKDQTTENLMYLVNWSFLVFS